MNTIAAVIAPARQMSKSLWTSSLLKVATVTPKHWRSVTPNPVLMILVMAWLEPTIMVKSNRAKVFIFLRFFFWCGEMFPNQRLFVEWTPMMFGPWSFRIISFFLFKDSFAFHCVESPSQTYISAWFFLLHISLHIPRKKRSFSFSLSCNIYSIGLVFWAYKTGSWKVDPWPKDCGHLIVLALQLLLCWSSVAGIRFWRKSLQGRFAQKHN